ncbi:MAG: hypothetical protein AB8F95_19940 [Bacteroidia bacterium]
MRYSYITELLQQNPLKKRYQLLAGANVISFKDFIQALKSDPAFCSTFNTILKGCEMDKFYFETPVVDRNSLNNPFEFVLIESNSLSNTPNPLAFSQYLDTEELIVSFLNLGKDAMLVVPTQQLEVEASAYAHIGSFVKEKDNKEQQAGLWKRVGEEYEKALYKQPVWLSTAGNGVAWLHVRICEEPKYYQHAVYAFSS